jgi:hypothetical protein
VSARAQAHEHHDDDHEHRHGHSHGVVDRSILRSRAGVRAVLVSLGVLGAAAVAQAIVFVLSGSAAAAGMQQESVVTHTYRRVKTGRLPSGACRAPPRPHDLRPGIRIDQLKDPGTQDFLDAGESQTRPWFAVRQLSVAVADLRPLPSPRA